MKIKSFFATLMVALTVVLAGFMPSQSEAATVGLTAHEVAITPIFGDDPTVSDQKWTTASAEDVTLGLRFREFESNNMPGDFTGTFYFSVGTAVVMDYSVYTSETSVANYYYTAGLDDDPSPDENYLANFFDPVLELENSYGDFSTPAAGGVEGDFSMAFDHSVAQNSLRMGFFIDTSMPGEYTNIFSAYSLEEESRLIAQTEVTVIIRNHLPDEDTVTVPDSGGTLFLGILALFGIIGLGRISRRRPAWVIKHTS